MKLISICSVLLCAFTSTFAANANSKQVTLIGSSNALCANNGIIYFNLEGELEGAGPRNFAFNADHVLAKVWLSDQRQLFLPTGDN